MADASMSDGAVLPQEAGPAADTLYDVFQFAFSPLGFGAVIGIIGKEVELEWIFCKANKQLAPTVDCPQFRQRGLEKCMEIPQ